MNTWKKAGVSLVAMMLFASVSTANAATNLRSPYKGTEFVALYWDYSAGENNSTIYNVYRDGLPVYTGASSSYTSYGLTACTSYTFTVAPQNGFASPVSLTVKTNCL